MNTQQINQAITLLDSYFDLEISKLVADQYPGQDLRNVNIGEISAATYVNLSIRATKQLQAELESDNGLFLPFQYNFHNEFGNGNIQSDLTNLVNQTSARHFPQSLQFLNRLIHYQINNGFWDKSKTKVHSLRGIQVTALEEKLNLLAEQLSNDISACKSLHSELLQKSDELSEFKVQKEKELSQITNNLASSNQESSQIAELHNKSISLNEKILSTLDNAKEKVETFKENFKENEVKNQESQKLADQLIKDVENKIAEFTSKNNEFENQLKEVESKKSFFDERNKYLSDLIGREVGASLFETFKQRKKELKPSVNFWRIAVPAMSLITIVGIYAIFSNLFGLIPAESEAASDGWRLFALRSLKTIPLFVLLYFTIHQYGKERHFKEEYAFKSAVALTVKAYADLVTDKDKKDEMILNSVTGVYTPPINTKPKEKTLPTKDISDIIKTVSDSASNIISKTKSTT